MELSNPMCRLPPVLLLVVMLFLLAPSWAHRLNQEAARMVYRRGPSIGLIMAWVDEDTAVQSSREFVPWPALPYLDLYGRRFHIGSIRGVNVIYAMSGQRRLNAGITVQIFLDIFNVSGVVHFGTAGSANDSLSFGDVSVPKFVAYTGAWTWKKFNSLKESTPELSFGAYNIPNVGGNLLASLHFRKEELYSVGKPMEEVFWLPVDSAWFAIAEKLKVKLERCVNATYCLPTAPKIVPGLKGSTADIFLDNAAYREFLFREFGVSTVDEESAAVVMAATSPDVPVIIVRGVSDLAGGEPTWSSTSLSGLASINALKVAVEFIAAVGKKYWTA